MLFFLVLGVSALLPPALASSSFAAVATLVSVGGTGSPPSLLPSSPIPPVSAAMAPVFLRLTRTFFVFFRRTRTRAYINLRRNRKVEGTEHKRHRAKYACRSKREERRKGGRGG